MLALFYVALGALRATAHLRAPHPVATAPVSNWEDFPGGRVLFRPGERSDTIPIAKQLLQMKMNPLSLSTEDFIVCESGNRRIGFAQIRKLAGAEPKPLWELASVYIDDEWRGSGVGSALVNRLLVRHSAMGRVAADIYLLTLAPTAGWYERLGFGCVPKMEVPRGMAFELAAGEALSAVLGNELVCMRMRADPR